MNLFKNKNLFSITEEIKQEISKNYKKIMLILLKQIIYLKIMK